MSDDIKKQITDRLSKETSDLQGAEDLIDAHLDEVSSGFSLHIQFGNS